MYLYDEVLDPASPWFGYKFGFDLDPAAPPWIGLSYWGGDNPIPKSVYAARRQTLLAVGIGLAKHLARTREPANLRTTAKYEDMTIHVTNKTGNIMVRRDPLNSKRHHVWGSLYMQGADSSELYMYTPLKQIFFIKDGKISEVDQTISNLPGGPPNHEFPGAALLPASLIFSEVARSGDGSIYLQTTDNPYNGWAYNYPIWNRVFRLKGGVLNGLEPEGSFGRVRFILRGAGSFAHLYEKDGQRQSGALISVAVDIASDSGTQWLRLTDTKIIAEPLYTVRSGYTAYGSMPVAVDESTAVHAFNQLEASGVVDGYLRYVQRLFIEVRSNLADPPMISALPDPREVSLYPYEDFDSSIIRGTRVIPVGDGSAMLAYTYSTKNGEIGQKYVQVLYTESVSSQAFSPAVTICTDRLVGQATLGAHRIIIWTGRIGSTTTIPIESYIIDKFSLLSVFTWPKDTFPSGPLQMWEDGTATLITMLSFERENQNENVSRPNFFWQINRDGSIQNLGPPAELLAPPGSQTVVSSTMLPGNKNIVVTMITRDGVQYNTMEFLVYIQTRESITPFHPAYFGKHLVSLPGVFGLGESSFCLECVAYANTQILNGTRTSDLHSWVDFLTIVEGVLISQRVGLTVSYGIPNEHDSTQHHPDQFLSPDVLMHQGSCVVACDNALYRVRAKGITKTSKDPDFLYYTKTLIAGPFTEFATVNGYDTVSRYVHIVNDRIYIWPDGPIDDAEVFVQKGGPII